MICLIPFPFSKEKDSVANYSSLRCSAGHGISKHQPYNCSKLLNQFIPQGVYGMV